MQQNRDQKSAQLTSRQPNNTNLVLLTLRPMLTLWVVARVDPVTIIDPSWLVLTPWPALTPWSALTPWPALTSHRQDAQELALLQAGRGWPHDDESGASRSEDEGEAAWAAQRGRQPQRCRAALRARARHPQRHAGGATLPGRRRHRRRLNAQPIGRASPGKVNRRFLSRCTKQN